MLYSKAGTQPQELPFSDHDADGNVWTDLAHNPSGRAACQWVEAPQPGYDPTRQYLEWSQGTWHIIALDIDEAELDDMQEKMLQTLADIRWAKQQVVMFGGNLAPADDVTIGRCTAAKEYAIETGLDMDAPRNWKLSNGVWTTLTTNQIIAYGLVIGTHMQACFDHEKALNDAILGAPSMIALKAIDLNADWPA